MNNNIDALIFDMDGTLWDGVPAYAEALNVFFSKNNISRRLKAEHIYKFMGLEEAEYLAKVLPEFQEQERKDVYKIVEQEQNKIILSQGGILFEGVLEGLARLHYKYKLFIVSNCAKDTIRCFVKWAGIEGYITSHIAHGENYKSKSHNIRLLVDKYKLKSPVYIGDTDGDRSSAQKAGLPFFFVDYGFGESDKYHKKFSSFDELTNYLLA